MKIRKIPACLLTVILVCCSILTGCSDKDTMFSDMKEISQIQSAEYSIEGDITVQSEEEDIQYHISMDGKTNGQSAAMNFSVSSGALTFTLDDFIRMTDSTVYINLSSVFSTLLDTSDMDGLKSWVSVPVSSLDDETAAMYKSFCETIIDSMEKACRDQDITKDGETWTLNIPADRMASFTAAALDEIDANVSSWYDLYVEFLKKTGTANLMKDYASLMTGELSADEEENTETDKTEDTDEDPVQALKDNKDEFLHSWAETSISLRENLKDMEEAISREEVTTSGSLNVSLTGQKGSRTAEEAVNFQYEDKTSSGKISISMKEKITETQDISVEAPDAADVMTMDELSELMSSFFGDSLDSGLSEEEMNSIQSSLKDGQIYLFDSQYNDMVPYVITYDSDIYTPELQVNDYYSDLYIKGTECYASLTYEKGDFEQDMKDYYLEDGDVPVKLSTNAGEVTCITGSEDGYSYAFFGIQLTENAYLSGSIEAETADDLNMEECIKGLLKDIRPFETPSSAGDA